MQVSAIGGHRRGHLPSYPTEDNCPPGPRRGRTARFYPRPPPHTHHPRHHRPVLRRVQAIDSLDVYAVGGVQEHRHTWADMLRHLLLSFIDACNSVVHLSKQWDSDFAIEPPDVTVKMALEALKDGALAYTPLVASCDDAREDPEGVGPMDDGDRTDIQGTVHPGVFVHPYLSLLDNSTRSLLPIYTFSKPPCCFPFTRFLSSRCHDTRLLQSSPHLPLWSPFTQPVLS